MMLDIAALQQMYGANFGTNAGDTVYRWSATTGEMSINGAGQGASGANRIFMTVWDGGGTDTYDFSNYSTRVVIDLRPGEWSDTGLAQRANLGSGEYARGNVANALLYEDDPRSLIENAKGGSAADLLIANDAANRLTGGDGQDTFRWTTVDSAGLRRDTVTDFHSGTDRIDLSGIDANVSTARDDAFYYVGTAEFADSDLVGQLRYEIRNGNMFVQGDVDGDGVADFEIGFLGAQSLAFADVFL
jgi:serralysin